VNPYVAPLDEIRFTLYELTDIERIAQQAGAEVLTDHELVDAILDQAARFAREVLAPLDTVGDREGATWSEEGVTTAPGFAEAYRQFVESGWNNVAISDEDGGQGLPAVLCTALQEMFVSANKSFCFCPELTLFGVKALANAASAELKAQYIPKLVSGEWTATMNLTEPQAGSDVGALRTRAVPQPDGSYRIFGQKIFISYGDHDLADNIIHLVLAKTPGAPEGSRGVSLFLVPKVLPEGERNDVQCTGIEHKLGSHASPTCTLVYGDSGEGAIGWLVGQENKGLQAMFVMVNSARFNVGMEGVSIAERAYQQALNYARERVQGRLAGGGSESVPIIRHPDVRRMLLLMRCQTEAMRGLAYVIAAARDLASRHADATIRNEQQAFVGLMIPIFKGWASETGVDVASTSIQVHGGLGYIEESGVSQPFRDLRVAPIYEGTTSIQAHDLIERKLVRDGGVAFRAWQSQLHSCLQQLQQNQAAELDGIEGALRQAVAELEAVVDWALANYGERSLEVLAVSVPVLHLCGIVAGGWQMARAALAAQRFLQAEEGNAAFMRRKLLSARLYATHVLPEATSLAVIATGGGGSVMALGDEAF
jgi:alkylation response protein AidB-like acyl-CoA dehydrogenase